MTHVEKMFALGVFNNLYHVEKIPNFLNETCEVDTKKSEIS